MLGQEDSVYLVGYTATSSIYLVGYIATRSQVRVYVRGRDEVLFYDIFRGGSSTWRRQEEHKHV